MRGDKKMSDAKYTVEVKLSKETYDLMFVQAEWRKLSVKKYVELLLNLAYGKVDYHDFN